MQSFLTFISELYGKGSLEAIQKHHHEVGNLSKTKRGSAAAQYHGTQVARADKDRQFRDRKVPEENRKYFMGYRASDSQKAKKLKSQIKPTDYRK